MERRLPGTVSLDFDNTIATFDPTSDLTTLQSYTVTVSGVKIGPNSLTARELVIYH